MIKTCVTSFVGMIMCGSVFASNAIELLQNSVFPQYSDSVILRDALEYSELCENSKNGINPFLVIRYGLPSSSNLCDNIQSLCSK